MNIKMNITSASNDESDNKEATGKPKEENKIENSPYFFMPMLLVVVFACTVSMYKSLDALYFGMFILLIIILFYIFMAGLYIFNRYKIKNR